MHLTLLPNSCIAFDNLHNHLSNVRKFWDYIRNYVDVYGYELQENFTKILKRELTDCYVQCHNAGNSLAVTHGEQIKALIVLIPEIINFLN